MSWLVKLFKGTLIRAVKVAAVVAVPILESRIDEEKGLGPKQKLVVKRLMGELIEILVKEIEDNL